MSDFPTANFSGSDDGLFTVAEIRALMEAEFDRALRYQYPLVFMALVVDRLEHLQDLYGYESKGVILRSVTDLLQSVSRSSDFLGCLVEDRVLVLLPYTTPQGADAIARRLLSGARSLKFDGDGNMLQVTVSIGASHNQGDSPHAYVDLIRTAESALTEARAEGGDRYLVREAAPPPTRLRRRSDARGGPSPHSAPGAAPTPLPATDPSEEAALFDRIREYLVLQGDLPGSGATRSEGLEQEIVSSVVKAIRMEREAERADQVAQPPPQAQPAPANAGDNDRLELLERRLSKLSDSLSSTEQVLTRIAQTGAPDEGIASIYRGVQGLSDDEPEGERKQEMMSQIFQANLELQAPADG